MKPRQDDPFEPMIITTRRRRVRRVRRPFPIGPWLARVCAGAIGLGLAGLFVSSASQPFLLRHHQKLETAALRDALSRAREENASLKHQVELLRSGAGLEVEARRLGYIRKGETPIRILNPPP